MKNIIAAMAVIALVLLFAYSMVNVEQRLDVLKAENEQLKVALHFEHLFMTFANPNQVMDFSALENYICEKRGFCTTPEDHENHH